MMGGTMKKQQRFEEHVNANIKNILLPLVEKLILRYGQGKDLLQLKKEIENIVSSYGITISDPAFRLTRREIEICNMIRNGLTTKQIADLINISPITVERHRNNIRKKFGINNEKEVLSDYLRRL